MTVDDKEDLNKETQEYWEKGRFNVFLIETGYSNLLCLTVDKSFELLRS